MCPCGCGQPLEVAEDKTQAFTVHTFTCRARKAIEKVRRDDMAKHEKHPDGWDDGLTYYVVPAEDNRAEQPPQPSREQGRRRRRGN